MVRRTGYVLGLLFVLACALAYPLTWGRGYNFNFFYSRDSFVFAYFSHGRIRAGAMDTYPLTADESRFEVIRSVASYRNGDLTKFYMQRGFGRTAVSFPLWWVALPVSLFIAWRWRRGRTRRAAGFPMDTGATTVPPDRSN